MARPTRSPTASFSGSARRSVLRIEQGRVAEDDDRLAEEVPVAMHVDGMSFAVMMATPLDIEDFARGFALTERWVTSMDDIASIEIREVIEGITVDVRRRAASPVESRREIDTPQESASRQLPGRTGCGICGSRELEDVVRHPNRVGDGPSIDASAIERALTSLRHAQPVNAITGAVHAAGWCSADGALIAVREDVGRHNALDKLIGALLVAGIDTNAGFVVITSRASYEMVTKAAMARIAIVVAISAPTALAVHVATDVGVTLAGFARPGRFNVYSHRHRIV